MGKVLTEAFSTLFPQSLGILGVGMGEYDDKEIAKCRTGGYDLPGLIQTLFPFIVTLQETSSDASGLKSGIGPSLISAKLLKGTGTLDNSEKGSEKVALSAGWTDKVHAPKSIAVWVGAPLPGKLLWFPDVVLWHVEVVDCPGKCINPVGFEIGHELCLCIFSSLLESLVGVVGWK